MPSSFKRQVAGQPLAQVDNPDPFAVPVWRSPVYQTPHLIIWPVQLVRLVWRRRVVRAAAPAARRRSARVAGLHLAQARLARPRRPGLLSPLAVFGAGRTCCGRTGSPGTSSRRRGTTGGCWFYRRRWTGRDDPRRSRPFLPGPRPGAGPRRCPRGRSGRPGDGAAGDRAVPRRIRRPDAEPRPCLRRAAVPRPRRQARPRSRWSSSAPTPSPNRSPRFRSTRW